MSDPETQGGFVARVDEHRRILYVNQALGFVDELRRFGQEPAPAR